MPTTTAPASEVSRAIIYACLLSYDLKQRLRIRDHYRRTGQREDLKDHDAETRGMHAACASAYLEASRLARDAGLPGRARALANRYATQEHLARYGGA